MKKEIAKWAATAAAALFLSNPGKLDAQFTDNRLASGTPDAFGVGAGANGNVYVGAYPYNSTGENLLL